MLKHCLFLKTFIPNFVAFFVPLATVISCPGGVLDLSLGWGMPPGPGNPDPVYDKKLVKILKN